MSTLLLVHGGLWEDLGADHFWSVPGITAGLVDRGFTVLAPDRLRRPASWSAEAAHLAASLPAEPVTVIAASNGCAAAVHLANRWPARVRAMLLGWPATAADPAVDEVYRQHLHAQGASATTVDDILAPGILRGVTAVDLIGLDMPLALLPGFDVRSHPHQTVAEVARLLPGATVLPPVPPPVHQDFPAYLPTFLDSVTGWLAS